MKSEAAPRKPLIAELGAGGLSCAVASTCTNPMDVIKIRQQVQRSVGSLGSELMYTTFRQTAARILAEEGFRGLCLPGLTASLLREGIYSSLRFGLYMPVKASLGMNDGRDPGLLKKLAAGMITGAIGSCIANPTDLVKIRLQSEAGLVDSRGVYVTGLRKGFPTTYKNTFHSFYIIGRDEGLKGLYKGVEATAARAAFITAGQLASYDHSKYILKNHGWFEEGFKLHIVASIISGLVATTISAPADLVKSRIMGDHAHKHYKGVSDCLYRTFRDEGFRTLFKGWLPSYLRLAPHTIISLPLFEQFRKMFGLGNM